MKRKKVLHDKKTVFIVLVCIVLCFTTATAINKPLILIDGAVSHADVRSINGVFYVPLRPFAQSMGASVQYDAKTRQVHIYSNDSSAQMNQIWNINGLTFSNLTYQDSKYQQVLIQVYNGTDRRISIDSYQIIFYDARGSILSFGTFSIYGLEKNKLQILSSNLIGKIEGYKRIVIQ